MAHDSRTFQDGDFSHVTSLQHDALIYEDGRKVGPNQARRGFAGLFFASCRYLC